MKKEMIKPVVIALSTFVLFVVGIIVWGGVIKPIYDTMYPTEQTECPPVWKCNGSIETNDPRCCLDR